MAVSKTVVLCDAERAEVAGKAQIRARLHMQ